MAGRAPLSRLISRFKALCQDTGRTGIALAAQSARPNAECPARQQNDDALRALNTHFNVSVVDYSGRIVEVNENLCRLSGYSRDELLGSAHSVVGSRLQTEFSSELWRTIAGGEVWRGDIRNLAKDGSSYWLNCIITPLMGSEGLIDRYRLIGSDITKAKSTEQRLRASENLLDRTSQVAGIGNWQMDLETQAVEWSANMHRIHDTSPEYRPTVEDGLSHYAQESQALIARAMRHARDSGTGWDLELQLSTRRGRMIWVRSMCTVECCEGRAVRLVGSTQDITANKQSQKALTYERDLMASLLETLPDQIYFKDLAGRYLRINAGMARTHGLKNPAEAIGKSDADFYPSANALQAASIERRIIECGEPVLEMEEEVRWADRPATWVLSTKMPLYDADDRIVGTFGISRDITVRKQIQARLQETATRFSIAADSAGIGVWEFEPGSATVNWDDRMCQLYGIDSPAGLQPYTAWFDALHAEDRVRCQEEIAAALRGDGEYDSEFRIVTPLGEVRHLKAAARTMFNPDGTAARMVGVNIDITQRRRAERSLLETSSLLRTILDSAAETSVIATDRDLKVTVFNAGASRLLGYESEQVVDRYSLTRFHDRQELLQRADDLGSQRGHCVEAGTVLIDSSVLDHARDWTYVRSDGRHITVSLMMSTMHNFMGDLIGYLGVAHDVTHSRILEESLREATHRAEQANRAKSQFLANMSHEIRTPMNAVIGLSYLLSQTQMDSEQQEFLSKIQSGSKSLLAVINDVLDLTKIEAGELIVERVPFSPEHLMRGVCGLMSMNAHAKGISFEFDLEDTLPEALYGDPTRLAQILTNLLSNAIKFTDHGGVKLSVKKLDDNPAGVRLRFVVSDTGIGIAPAAQVRLFAPFAQADASITRRYGGTGLGLSIVKSLAQLLEGDVSIKSNVGVGSEFSLELKFERASVAELAAKQPPVITLAERALRGVRVLVVDDSEINLDVTKRILELHGARVWVAGDGLQAVERLRAQPLHFDVVLMDVQMPVLDGYQASSRIREELGLVDIPIIALTAGALSSERQRAIAAGMDDFIVKPFDARTLASSILRHVKISSTQAEPIDFAGFPEAAGSPWPVIEGIDGADACERLMGDVELFCSGLKRLLEEFTEVRLPAASENAQPMEAYLARMHKLTGSAGLLGAREIQQLAIDIRVACVAKDLKHAGLLAARLADQLRTLRESAAAVLQSRQDESSLRMAAAQPAIDPQQIRDFSALLQSQSLSALHLFATLTAQLRQHLGEVPFGVLRDHIAALRFSAAADLLADHDDSPLADSHLGALV